MQKRIPILEVIVDFFIGLIVIILAIRLAFEILASNRSNEFVNWIYTVSDKLMKPLSGIFSRFNLGRDHVLDISAIFAILAYLLIGYILGSIIRFLFSRNR